MNKTTLNDTRTEELIGEFKPTKTHKSRSFCSISLTLMPAL